DLLLTQKFLPTEFDWRVGVRAATGRSSSTAPDGSSREGGFPTFELDKAPPSLIDIAVRAAWPIGEGFYGVDVKETDRGFIAWRSTTIPTSSTASRTRPARTRSGSACSSGSSSASSNSGGPAHRQAATNR